MTRVVRKLTCHSADGGCASWHRRLRCRGDRARTNARAAEARAAGGVTYEEAELAVVAAELDGGGERGGRHEDGGGTDDGSLRGSEQRETSAFRVGWWFFGTRPATGGAPRSSVEARDARRVGDGSFGSDAVARDSFRIEPGVASAPRHRTPDARHPYPRSRAR